MTRRDEQLTNLDRLARAAEADRKNLSRRGFLVGAASITALGGSGLLAACGGSSSSGGSSPSGGGTASAAAALPGGTPVRGGTFTRGRAHPGQPGESVPRHRGPHPRRRPRLRALQPALLPERPGQPVPAGAGPCAVRRARTPTPHMWTFKLRDGVTWHDGKDFGGQRRRLQHQSCGATGQELFVLVPEGPRRLQGCQGRRQADGRRSRCSFRRAVPHASSRGSTSACSRRARPRRAPPRTRSVPARSSTNRSLPGKQSVFVRNENYWEEGKPYVDPS